MRILFLNPVGVVGGAERVLLATVEVARACWSDVQVDVDVVLMADGPLRADLERRGAAVSVVPLPDRLARQGDSRLRGRGWVRSLAGLGGMVFGQTPAALGFVRRLRAVMRRFEADLIHSNGLKAHVLAGVSRPRGVPVLWHLHDFPSHRPVIARVLRRMAAGAAGAIAVSEAVRRDAQAILPGLAVVTVLNPVDTDHFTPGPRSGIALDRMAELPPALPGTVRVGLTATYANWKGQDVFLQALARLAQAGAAVRGYIVGGPIYTTTGSQFSRDELRGLADRLGIADRVGFVPFQEDTAEIYRMLDVAVHASIRPEPFGLTIAEAMACGRPVVVANAGGAAELFTPEHDGLGHIPGDAEDLARVIGRLVADPALRDRLGANARRTARERFSMERYAREIASVYEACLGAGLGPSRV